MERDILSSVRLAFLALTCPTRSLGRSPKGIRNDGNSSNLLTVQKRQVSEDCFPIASVTVHRDRLGKYGPAFA